MKTAGGFENPKITNKLDRQTLWVDLEDDFETNNKTCQKVSGQYNDDYSDEDALKTLWFK